MMMAELLVRIQSVPRELLLILLNILSILFLYPVLLFIYIPFWLHRQLAILIVKGSDPSVGAILSGASANFAACTPYSNPTFVLIPHYIFSGQLLGKSEIIQHFQSRILNARDDSSSSSSGGRLLFPELQQRIVARWGYHFWKQVEDFRVEDHVRYLDPSNPEAVLRKEEIFSKILPLTTAPFPPERSPWEWILVRNFVDGEEEKKPSSSSSSSKKSALFFRIHHALADGYSLTNIMRRLSSEPWEDFRGKMKAVPRGIGGPLSKLALFLNVALTTPYHVLKSVSMVDDNSPWVRTAKEDWKGSPVMELGGPFDVHKLKQIKNHFGVNMSSVLLAILAGALGRAMKRAKVKVKEAGVVDRHHVLMVWPLPGRRRHSEDGLGNHFSIVTLPLPLLMHQENGGGLEHSLAAIDSEYNKMRSSVIPWATMVLTNLMGSLPVALIPAEGRVGCTAMLSNFPITSGKIDAFGAEVEELRVLGTIPKGYVSVTFCLTYRGQVTFFTGGDSAILKSREELDYLCASFREAFNELYALANV